MGVDLPLGDIGGRMLVVDGYSGDLFIEPNQVILTEYRQLLGEERALDTLVRSVETSPPRLPTAPGLSAAQRGLSADTEISLNHLADRGRALSHRDPFMLQDSFPSGGSRLPAIAGSWKPIGIARFACGLWTWGDKQLPYFPIVGGKSLPWLAGDPAHPGSPELFLVQLKAMLRASEGLDNLAIMLPMISSVGEIKGLPSSAGSGVARGVGRSGQPRCGDPLPQSRVMIEVPSALYILPEMALIDFWSVGSNDLTQYLLAVDRNNARVASIYDAFHPAVIRAFATAGRCLPALSQSRSLFVASWLAIRSVCYCCWPWAIAVSA